jgi:hypothetical protein
MAKSHYPTESEPPADIVLRPAFELPWKRRKRLAAWGKWKEDNWPEGPSDASPLVGDAHPGEFADHLEGEVDPQEAAASVTALSQWRAEQTIANARRRANDILADARREAELIKSGESGGREPALASPLASYSPAHLRDLDVLSDSNEMSIPLTQGERRRALELLSVLVNEEPSSHALSEARILVERVEEVVDQTTDPSERAQGLALLEKVRVLSEGSNEASSTGVRAESITLKAETVTLKDAVDAAHAEGAEFGTSVARDSEALWLDAILARKPRLPSDLEAKLLQGSRLPIDFLLHDEVRHALRRGFWDALEQNR